MIDRCPNCHAKLPPFRDDFCARCGADLLDLPDPSEFLANQLEAERGRAIRATVFLSAFFYVAVIGATLDHRFRRKLVEAFGARAFGMPILAVEWIILTILYLPMPFIFWHGWIIFLEARSDGHTIHGLFSTLAYLFSDAKNHEHLKVSRWVAIAGASYYILICASWIVYAAIRRI